MAVARYKLLRKLTFAQIAEEAGQIDGRYCSPDMAQQYVAGTMYRPGINRQLRGWVEAQEAAEIGRS